MLYLSLPEGMIFKRKEITTKNETREMDVLIDETGEKEDILLQDIIKEYLRSHHDRRRPYKTEDEVIIYHRKPSLMDLDLLEYQPNNNGTKPSEHVKRVNSKELAKTSANHQTRYGQRWFNEAPLSKERREEVLKQDEATRLNRRKTGDSPNAN